MLNATLSRSEAALPLGGGPSATASWKARGQHSLLEVPRQQLHSWRRRSALPLGGAPSALPLGGAPSALRRFAVTSSTLPSSKVVHDTLKTSGVAKDTNSQPGDGRSLAPPRTPLVTTRTGKRSALAVRTCPWAYAET